MNTCRPAQLAGSVMEKYPPLPLSYVGQSVMFFASACASAAFWPPQAVSASASANMSTAMLRFMQIAPFRVLYRE